MLVFALELVVGVLAYGYESQVDDELLMTLNETFVTSYGVDETRTNSIDLMQQTVSFYFRNKLAFRLNNEFIHLFPFFLSSNAVVLFDLRNGTAVFG